MIVKNNHPQRLSNGEVGIIWPDFNGKLLAWFETQDGNLRSISLSRIPAFETVFAMTIHKSQGSEFKYVVLLLPKPESEKAAGLFSSGPSVHRPNAGERRMFDYREHHHI